MSGRLYLLDTNILLALVRGGDFGRAIDARFGLQAASTRPLVSIVTHGEIKVMARRNGWGAAKLAALERALDQVVTVDINHPRVIDAYVEVDLYSQQHPEGARNMGKNDLWIAACAHAADAVLLTTDADFGHIPDQLVTVQIITPGSTRGATATS